MPLATRRQQTEGKQTMPDVNDAAPATAPDEARVPETPMIETRRRPPDTPEGFRPGQIESRVAARSIVPRTYDREARSVEAVFATGYRVRRWFGWEELRIDEGAINMQRVALGQCRLLDSHNMWERGAVLGVVTEARVENGALIGRIVFADNDAGRAAEADVAAGTLRGISVGYRINRLVLAEMGEDDDDVYRAEEWELLEVSLVSVPADPNAGVRSAGDSNARIPTSTGRAGHHEERTMPDSITNAPAVEPGSEDTRAVETRQSEPQAIEPQAETAERSADIDAAVERALDAEATRVSEISGIGRRAGMAQAQIDEAIRGRVSVEAFRVAAFDFMAERDASTGARSSVSRVEFGGQDATQTRVDAMTNALMNRANPSVALTEPGRQFRGMTLIELARDSLEIAGVRTRGLSRSEIASRVFHSTSDFPHILADVANKSLRAAYAAYPRTFTQFCRQVSAPDFKTMHRVQLGEAPQLEKVNESGEFKRGSITEGKETIKVETYGKVVGITRQTLINDDLGAFTRIPGMFGTSIATLESNIVWALITGNVVMGDGVALFHATHKNLASGAALSVESIAATRTLMRKQKGLDGKTHLSITPRFLLVPSDLETKAEQILNSIIVPEQVNNAVPASIRGLTPITEPRLDGSATAFYLAADPATVDTIEYAYLEGQEGAYIETRQGFDVDGMEVKCRLDFGAAVIDFRGLAKNPGA